nr:nucleotidyl transferase AbiEii/AbiGii toxin family protein [Bacteroidota bacterium]
MLHTETVNTETIELIKELQSDRVLKDFILVGGTSLSLQIGHRISIDIDLFTQHEFDNQKMLEHLEEHYMFHVQYQHKNTLKGTIQGVFVDFIRHNYPIIRKEELLEGVRLASLHDIAAMKVNAITGNGSRIKDFIDIYFLLEKLSFTDIITAYKEKYKFRNEFQAVKSLTWFGDVIIENWPNLLLHKELTFDDVKEKILAEAKVYINN